MFSCYAILIAESEIRAFATAVFKYPPHIVFVHIHGTFVSIKFFIVCVICAEFTFHFLLVELRHKSCHFSVNLAVAFKLLVKVLGSLIHS